MQKSTLETLFKVSIYVFVSVGLSEVDPEEHEGRRLSQMVLFSYPILYCPMLSEKRGISVCPRYWPKLGQEGVKSMSLSKSLFLCL